MTEQELGRPRFDYEVWEDTRGCVWRVDQNGLNPPDSWYKHEDPPLPEPSWGFPVWGGQA